MTTISSAFWAEPVQGTVAPHTPSEKVLARIRWLALGIWTGFLWFHPSALLQTPIQYSLIAGLLYCIWGQYFAYRHYKGKPLAFPIGLTDVAFIAALCGVNGGLFSPAYIFFYGLTLIATLRFGWQGGFGIALASSLASGFLLLLVPPSAFSTPELYPSLAFRFALLIGIASLAGLFSQQPKPQENVAKAVPEELMPHALVDLREQFALLDIDLLLQRLVDQVFERIPCQGVCLVLLNPSTQTCVNVKTTGSFPSISPAVWDQALVEGGALRAALNLGPVALNTTQDIYARLQSLSEGELAQRHLLIHRLGENPRLGCLILADRNNREGFRPEDSHLLAGIIEYAVPAIRNAQNFTEASRSATELRSLLHAMLNAQEEERQRVVSEWHDQLGEKLFRVLQDFRGFQEFVLQHAPEGRERFDKLASELDAIAALVRQFADDLLPPVLENFGFVEALRAYVTGLQEHEPFEVVMQADDESQALSTQTSRKLFRITQEALHNVQKHAKANHVQIALTFEQSGVSLMIKDDGQGFQPEQFSPGHYGLLYMREQAVACGGQLTVQSERGHGTEVRVDVPV